VAVDAEAQTGEQVDRTARSVVTRQPLRVIQAQGSCLHRDFFAHLEDPVRGVGGIDGEADPAGEVLRADRHGRLRRDGGSGEGEGAGKNKASDGGHGRVKGWGKGGQFAV
jgi:hypothetical protein